MRHSWLTKFGVLCLNQLVRNNMSSGGQYGMEKVSPLDGGHQGLAGRPQPRALHREERPRATGGPGCRGNTAGT